MTDINETLDATGLNCPLPILRAKKLLNSMEPGERLQVIATDPGSVGDFDAFSRQTGHVLESSEEKDDRYYFLLRKSN